MESSGFFTSKLVDGNWDRTYVAEQFAQYFARFISNGVFMNLNSSSLMIESLSDEGMKIAINAGEGFINGYWYNNDSLLKKDITPADGILNRIDLIVARYDNEKRVISSVVIEGAPSQTPVEPEYLRNADFYDLVLARIEIPAGATKISSSQITDLRLDSNYCGSVGALVEQIDTSEYGSQLNNFIADYIKKSNTTFESFENSLMVMLNSYKELTAKFQSEAEEEFEAWFENIKSRWSEDAAGSLQLQIDHTNTKLDLLEIQQSTDYTLSNSIKGKLQIIEISGNSEQKTTSGKNLLNCSGLVEQTINGVTFTPVYAKNGVLEYIEVSGTASELAEYTLSSSYTTLIANEMYIFSGCPKDGSSSTYCIKAYANSQPTSDSSSSDFGEGGRICFNQEGKGVQLRISISSNYTAHKLHFYPMLRKEEITDDTYEPFTNGASPNPDYPQEIENVGTYDETSGKYIASINVCNVEKSKNLLDCSGLVETTQHGVTLTPVYDENGLLEYIEFNGTVNTPGYPAMFGITPSDMAIDVSGCVISGIPYVPSDNTFYMSCGYEESSGGHVSESMEHTFIADTEKTLKSVTIGFFDDYTVDHLRFYPMVRKADIEDNTYEPYRPYTDYTKHIYLDEPLRKVGSVADKIINKDGVWGVERNIGEIGSYSSETISTDYISTTGELSEGATIQYILVESTFEPFDIETQEVFYTLETYDSATYISIDSAVKPSTIKVEYGASKVGAYVLKSLQDAEILRNELNSLEDKLNNIVNGNEVEY